LQVVNVPRYLPAFALIRPVGRFALAVLLLCGLAPSQQTYTPEEVRVSDLPTLLAKSKDHTDILKTSLDTIIHDHGVCCGKDSALEDSVERADPNSLQDIASRLQGRHLLDDGRPIIVTAQYIAPEAINGELLIETLRKNHALLMLWNSHLYVLDGVSYVRYYDQQDGTIENRILKLLLIDTRYADARRNVEFDRQTDDWTKVQGVLWVSFTLQ
jgi:hypothetical protein